jgi:hypothetical protein
MYFEARRGALGLTEGEPQRDAMARRGRARRRRSRLVGAR